MNSAVNDRGERRFHSITGNRWWHPVPPDEVSPGDVFVWSCHRLNRRCIGIAARVHHGRKHRRVRPRQAWSGGTLLPWVEIRAVIEVWRKGRTS